MKLPHAVQGPPGLEPLYQVNVREENHGKSVLWQRFSTIICFVHPATGSFTDHGRTPTAQGALQMMKHYMLLAGPW